MQLSTRGRYAVMAMADLATRQAIGCECGPVCLAEIATRQHLSLAYLEQLFGKLRRAGLVASARGPGGGYRLARTSDLISIADVVAAVEEPIHATRCHDGGGCMAAPGPAGTATAELGTASIGTTGLGTSGVGTTSVRTTGRLGTTGLGTTGLGTTGLGTTGLGTTGLGERCQTHDLWHELGRQIALFLAGVSLADVVAGRVAGRAVPVTAAAEPLAAD